MRIELRLTNTDRLHEALDAPVDAIGLGQEGCPHRLPPVGELRRAAEAVRGADRDFTLVLPQAWERFADQVIDTALTVAADGPVTVIANDMGTVIALAAAGLPAQITLAVGQGLVYGYAQSPLADSWLSGERPDLARALATANIVDNSTMNVMANLGVTAVETDSVTAAATPASAFLNSGLQLRTVLDAAVVGIARACPTARHRAIRPEVNCRDVCDSGIYRLHATQKWRLVDGHRESMTRTAREAAGSLAVSGNVVYRPTGTPAPDHADVAVLDARWHTAGQLAEAITAVRSQVSVDAAPT